MRGYEGSELHPSPNQYKARSNSLVSAAKSVQVYPCRLRNYASEMMGIKQEKSRERARITIGRENMCGEDGLKEIRLFT